MNGEGTNSILQYDGHVGLVTGIVGNAALVEFRRSDACGHCNACMSLSDGRMQTKVKNTLHARPGDRVLVSIQASKIVHATLIAYGIPLVMLVLGLYLGSLISEIASAVLGLGLCALSYGILHKLEPKFAKNEAYQPKMIRIVSLQEENENE